MITLGIDPGLSGALAWVDADGTLLYIIDMPTVELTSNKKTKSFVSADLLALAIRSRPGQIRAVVEKVGAMPGQGVTSMFSFGRSVGVIDGVLAGLQIPTERVTPHAWGKASAKKPGKDGARARCMELWPSQSDYWKFAKNDGRADAALIARFGRGSDNTEE